MFTLLNAVSLLNGISITCSRFNQKILSNYHHVNKRVNNPTSFCIVKWVKYDVIPGRSLGMNSVGILILMRILVLSYLDTGVYSTSNMFARWHYSNFLNGRYHNMQ